MKSVPGQPLQGAPPCSARGSALASFSPFAALAGALFHLLLPGGAIGQAAALAGPPAHGPHPFVTILCRFAGTTAEPAPPSHFASLLAGRYPGLGDYWRAVSYGAISLDSSTVAGWYALPDDRASYVPPDSPQSPGLEPGPHPALQRLAEDCTAAAEAGVDWSRYFGINLVFNEELGDHWGGRACLRRAGIQKCYGATWFGPSAFAKQAIWAHEMGHALGLPHSGTEQDKYADVWDVMSAWGPCWPDPGVGQVAQEPIAYHKDLLGWIPPARKFLASPSGRATITLERLAAPARNGFLLAKIPIEASPTHFYTVEARRRAGYDLHLPGDAVVIHEVDTLRAVPARPVSRRPALTEGAAQANGSAMMWLPGSRFRDAGHAIAVSVDRATDTGFVVTIYTGSLPSGSGWDASSPAATGREEAAESTFLDGRGRAYRLWRADSPNDGQGSRRDVLLFAARAPGGDWGPAERVNGRDAGSRLLRPALAVDGAGNAYAAWLDNRAGTFDVYFAYRPVHGAWTAAARINDDAGGVHLRPALAVDAAGNALAAWVDYRAAHPAIYSAYRPAGGQWGANVRVSEFPGPQALPSVAIDGQGDLYVAWVGRPDCTYRGATPAFIYLSVRPAPGPGLAWQTRTVLTAETTASPSGPHLAVDGSGIVHLAWQEDGRPRQASYFAGRLLP